MLPEHGKQEATEYCLKCHTLPEGVPFLKDIPHLGRLFRRLLIKWFCFSFLESYFLDLKLLIRLSGCPPQRVGLICYT